MLMLKISAIVGLCAAATAAMPVLASDAHHDPSADKDCSAWQLAKAGDTCDIIAIQRFTTVANLKIWNPVLNVDDCDSALVPGDKYCVFVYPGLSKNPMVV